MILFGGVDLEAGEGKNILGKIIMEVHDDLKRQNDSE